MLSPGPEHVSTPSEDTIPFIPGQLPSDALNPALDATPGLLSPSGQGRAAGLVGTLPDSPPPGILGYLSKYELIRELAPGGMGIVYEARDTVLKRVVALKLLRSGASARREEVLRFLREAQAAAQFQDPRIVPILEIGEHRGQHYFSMPFVADGSLAEARDRYRGRVGESVELMSKIARAVHLLHRRGLVHRDLKPANILLDEMGEPLITDFGLVKVDAENLELTQRDQRMGTLPYMAPEQVAVRHEAVGPPTDVWALGVMLFQLLTGHRPFPGPSEFELIRQIEEVEPISTEEIRSTVDGGLEGVIRKCLQKRPADRFADAGALADELDRWLHGQPTLTPPETWLRRQARRLKRRWAWVASAVLLGVATALSLALLRSPDSNRGWREIAEQLQQGEPVVLIGATGGPRAWRMGAIEPQATAMVTPGGEFQVSGTSNALVTLVPDPMVDHYRLRAEVRHDSAAFMSMVGIFCLHESAPHGNGQLHAYCEYWFNDIVQEGDPVFLAQMVGPPAPNPVRVMPIVYGDSDQPEVVNMTVEWLHSRLCRPALESPRDWRRLVIEVSPTQVLAWFDDQLVGERTRESLVKNNESSLLSLQSQSPPGYWSGHWRPTFNSRGALGLMVRNGSASFRNVVLEPLGP